MLSYDENGNLVEFDENTQTVKCPHCNRKYIQEQIEQTPGDREVSDDVCPYCHAVNDRSGDVEYINHKIDDADKADTIKKESD